ncbi:unnamed protein product [Didymodactylos carnosus]|uniref:Uncharacterized protein n=1 Tax=Didymodactylos carnosus TaxID=1234261 RepID=A0A814V0B1_9BILA|nr:unnamed protein product [Didymodactylos carnosus]CAF3945584.1 unnamed protein product [Didymodactylos carnosus]
MSLSGNTDNGYPPYIMRKGVREGELITKRLSQSKQKMTPVRTIYFTMPYYGRESIIFTAHVKKACKRLMPLVKVNFAFRKTLTIKSAYLPLLKGNDASKKLKKLVYKVGCKNCDRVYVGETARERKTKMDEHARDVRNGKVT